MGRKKKSKVIAHQALHVLQALAASAPLSSRSAIDSPPGEHDTSSVSGEVLRLSSLLSPCRDALLAGGESSLRFAALREVGEEGYRQSISAAGLAEAVGWVIRDVFQIVIKTIDRRGRDVTGLTDALPVLAALDVGICLQAYHEPERRHMQQALAQARQTEQRWQQTESLAALGTWELEALSGSLSFNQRAAELLGLTGEPSSALGGHEELLTCVLPSDRTVLQTLRNHTLISGEDYELRYTVSSDGVSARSVLERGRGMRGSDGRVSRLLGVVFEANPSSNEGAAQTPLSILDSLTGLSNRVHFHRSLQCEIEACAGQSEVFSVLVVDINRFEQINDTRGHAIGDQVLIEVGRRMRRVLRAGEHIARLGDDEFAVIASSADPHSAALIADRLAGAINQPFVVTEAAINLSSSIGTSSFPFDGGDAEALLICAATAMNEAKRGGQSSAAYQPEMSQRIHRRASIEAKLEHAIQQRLIEVHFQPQVALNGARLVGAEVLARWQDCDLGMVDPAEFILLAEDCGLIHSLGRLIVEQSFDRLRRWRSQGVAEGMRLAINMSSKQFEREGFVEFLLGSALAFEIDPCGIDLELTESSVMRNPEQITLQLGQLRDKGFGISIDDFGTGYSSLSHLRQLPITQIKLDRSFVAGLLQNRRDLSVVNATLIIANDLEVSLVAEGVETKNQAEKLKSLGYALGQGYFFDRPLPESIFAANWLSLAGPSLGSGRPP